MLIRDEQGAARGILERGRVIKSYGTDPVAEGPLRSIMKQMPGIHWTTDQNLCITLHWGKGLASSRISPDAFVGRSVCEFLGSADRHTTPVAEHYRALRGFPSHFEYGWKCRSWEIRLESLRTPSGEIKGCLGQGMDVTDRKKSDEQAHYQARHDALTGLANYREFMDRLEQEVSRAEHGHHGFTVLLLDLDGLKHINDLHGHLVGNRALQRLAAIMREHCRSTDLAVRYGGDEFAVVLIESDKGMAEQVAHRIRNGLRNDQGKPSISVSIGVGIYPDDGPTAPELIEAADQRLYKHKRTENRQTTSTQAQLSRTKRASR
jgi:diguanylate cyclase (GGDEF)-like protein